MFLVIVFVILMVVLSVIIITPPDPGPRVKGEKIRLDDIIVMKSPGSPGKNQSYLEIDRP